MIVRVFTVYCKKSELTFACMLKIILRAKLTKIPNICLLCYKVKEFFKVHREQVNGKRQ